MVSICGITGIKSEWSFEIILIGQIPQKMKELSFQCENIRICYSTFRRLCVTSIFVLVSLTMLLLNIITAKWKRTL